MRPGWPGSNCRLLYESGPLDAAESPWEGLLEPRAKLSDDLAQLGGRLLPSKQIARVHGRYCGGPSRFGPDAPDTRHQLQLVEDNVPLARA